MRECEPTLTLFLPSSPPQRVPTAQTQSEVSLENRPGVLDRDAFKKIALHLSAEQEATYSSGAHLLTVTQTGCSACATTPIKAMRVSTAGYCVSASESSVEATTRILEQTQESVVDNQDKQLLR